MKTVRIGWTVIIVAIGSSFGCTGGGCAGMVPTPGGFPANQRTANAGQIRVSSSGIASIVSDPAALVGGLLGGGGALPVVIDLVAQPGDDPRMEIHPVQGASKLNVIVRARMHTTTDIPVDVPLIGMCGVHIDTQPGPFEDVQLDIPVSFAQDAQAGTTRVEVGDVGISRLAAEDVALTGSFACQLASLGIGFFIDTLTGTFGDQIKSAITDQVCKACPSGDVGECGQFAASCDMNVCTKNDGTCLQELGLAGRLIANKLLGSLSPGTLGGIDLYEVAGGYGTTNNNGIALGLLGGMLPAGTDRDRCGPPATAPGPVTIPLSSYFTGNTRPDTGAPFDMAIGIHKSQLEQFAYAGYDGGFLCLTVGTRTIGLLTTDTLALIAGSLTNIVTETSPVAVGLRPQSPPTITLGLNTFHDMGGTQVVDDPLLDLTFSQMELDFFASVEGQYIRLFTLVTDVHLPIGLQVVNGQLVPVIGNVDDAFTNLSVKNSDALTEAPEDLAARFPSILALALPQLGAGLGGFSLPVLGGLQLNVTDITAVDNKQFMAIFADLAPATMTRAETNAEISSIEEPDDAVMNDPARWTKANRPRAVLQLAGDGLEWQVRIDDGLWTPWSANPRPTLSPVSFWVQGTHAVEVRARKAGEQNSADETPVVLDVPIGSIPGAPPKTAAARKAGEDFHGQAGNTGCNCSTGSASGGLPIVLAFFALLWPRRKRPSIRRLPAWLKWAAVIVTLGAGPGCSCSNSAGQCGDTECLPGEVVHSAGKWNGIATDGSRTVVSTYDPVLGDLVIVDVAGTDLIATAIDGIPDEPATYDPATYRGGIANEGPDVGAWTSIALHSGDARVSYQDRDTGGLKVAIENAGSWSSYAVDDKAIHTSITSDGNGHPVVAYLATGVAHGAEVWSELRLARAASADPGEHDWTHAAITGGPGSCAGMCGAGQACVAPAMAGDPETCVTATSDCAPACADTEVCSAGACLAAIADPTFVDLPTGPGLFPTVVALPDGRLAVVHYDRTRTALVLLVEDSAGAGTFTETILDGAGDDDRGIWASAVVDGSGTIHVAYQDALGDQVFYTSWNNGTPGAVELVDDGVRPPDRTHPVGAGASIYLTDGQPAIAYQDGLLADLVVARRSGGTWTVTPFTTGPLLDGFHIAATATGIAWDQLDQARAPADGLMVQAPP